MPLNAGIKTTSAAEWPAMPFSSLPAATVPDSTDSASVPLDKTTTSNGQRKKRRHRKRQETRRHQSQRRQQRHPAKNDSQPAREIQREAALGIQHLHAVFEREQQRRVVRVHKRDGQHAVGVEQIRRD